MSKTKDYERISPDMCLSCSALDVVLGELEYDRPTLYCHAERVGDGHQIAARYNLNLALHDGDTCEWYVEWQGRRVGTKGA